jgi:hypothetical protein
VAAAANGLSRGAQYSAFAAAVNLRSQDVPGFVVEPRSTDHHLVHNKAFEGGSQYRRCLGVGAQAKPVLKAKSDKFKAGEALHTYSTSSEVEVMTTVATARRELATVKRVFQDPGPRRCLARLFDALGSQSQPTRRRGVTLRVTVGDLRFAPLPVGSLTRATDGSFGMSMSLSVAYHVSARGRSVTIPTTLYVDGLAFAVGRAEVSLSTITLGAPFPPDVESRLFSLLVAKAATARLRYPAVDR